MLALLGIPAFAVPCDDPRSPLEDWFATGEDILAAADGVVTRVVTDLPNNAIDAVRRGELPLQQSLIRFP